VIDEILKKQAEQDLVSIDHLKSELGKVRTGRASASLLDGIKVNYYGTSTKLNQVATIGTPEPRLLTVQPFDKSAIQDIEKAIMAANIGLNPSSEGNLIRIPVPALTEERRKELVHVVKKYGEETRVAIRNYRRDANELVKKAQKDKELSEDEGKRAMDRIQAETDKKIGEVDKLIEQKEKDIMTI